MPKVITHLLADVHISYRLHHVEVPDACPECRTPFTGEEAASLVEWNLHEVQVPSKLKGDALQPQGWNESADTFHPFALYCRCGWVLAAGEESISHPAGEEASPPG